MNFYPRHIGDYARDTAHLTMTEHGAYNLLLDRYYATEAGIPADQAHRLARARTKEEKQAVDAVLGEFFTLVDGVWINRRAEEEIAKAQTRIKAAKENGRRGGRSPANRNETQEKPGGFPVGSENETQTKAHQKPYTKSHTGVTESGGNATTPAPTADAVRAPGRTQVDQAFEPDEPNRRTAQSLGLDGQSERERFVAHYIATGEYRANWQSQFRKWLLDSMQHRADAERRNGQRQSKDEQRSDWLSGACPGIAATPSQGRAVGLIDTGVVIDGEVGK